MRYADHAQILLPAVAIIALFALVGWHEDQDRMDAKIFSMQLQVAEAKAGQKVCEALK